MKIYSILSIGQGNPSRRVNFIAALNTEGGTCIVVSELGHLVLNYNAKFSDNASRQLIKIILISQAEQSLQA